MDFVTSDGPPNLTNVFAQARSMSLSGDIQQAVDFLNREIEGVDRKSLEYAAWFFSNFECKQLAALCLQRLSRHAALTSAQHAMLADAYLESDKLDKSVHHAAESHRLEPHKYTVFYATILQRANRHGDAVEVLIVALRGDGEKAQLYRELSSMCLAVGKHEQAFLAAKRAWELRPDDLEFSCHYSGLLLERREYAQAADVLSNYEKSGSASALFILSLAHSQLGNYSESLRLIADARLIDRDKAEFLMQHGAILCCIARYTEAADIFREVLNTNPLHLDARRACFAALTEAGRYEEAIGLGGALVSDFPQDDKIALTLQHILTRRFIDGASAFGGGQEYLVKKLAHLADNPRPARAPATVGSKLRIITALILREMRTRYGRSRLGYLWTIFEPLAHILVMVSLIKAFSHSAPPIGDDFAVFYFTGIIPYHLFVHTTGQMMSAIAANRPLLQLPPVNTTDVYGARAVLELTTTIVVSLLFISGFVLLGLNGLPINPAGVLIALGLLWATAVGIGLINSVIASFFDGWERIWGAVTSLIYFSSGTFYIPRIMPEHIREILAWSPVLQAIELVRVNYFNEPYPAWLDISYIAKLALISLTLGCSLEWLYRRKLLDVE